jgi:phosphoribosylformylglycinamidine synthase
MKPKTLVLHATGTNRDHDAAQAVEMAGGTAEIVHINQLLRGRMDWAAYQMLVLPGGFSYADALGAGKLLALDLRSYFFDQVQAFVAAGKPVIGICNGFQALVKSGVLPGGDELKATLTFNRSGRFECRWVTLQAKSQLCIWTRDLMEPIECPVAHGEGNFIVDPASRLVELESNDQVALIYLTRDGQPAGGVYPANPNGSMGDIAGICNPQGNVLGLMPHPENYIHVHQHPRWGRMAQRGLGLRLFENGIQYCRDR